MVHSMRCNPPHSHSIALDMFDGMTRRCFGDLTGVHPTAAQWQQAARGPAHGGLGLRSCEHHASAAFLASVGGSLAACAELDPAFSADEQKSSPAVLAALAHLNAHLPPHQALSVEAALSSKQRDLSHRVDAAGWAHQLSQATPIEQAVLHSATAPDVWNLQLFVRSSASGCWCLMQMQTPGVLAAMASWTGTAIMLPPALPVVNARGGIMLSAIWCASGPCKPVFALKRKLPIFCCLRVPMTSTAAVAALRTSSSLPWPGPLLHWISLSQRTRGKRLWLWLVKHPERRRQPMPSTRLHTCKQATFASSMEFAFCLWW